MAINRWLGTATAVAQVDTFTPANVEISDVFTLTVSGFDGTSTTISYTAAAATVADVTAGITAAWNNSTNALCTGITAEDNTTNMTLTADTAGVAFKVTSSATDGGGTDTQTFTRAATTANGGPNDWQDADNWSLGTVPGVTADDVYIENDSNDILYGLDNSGASNTLASVHIGKTYTGKIGHNGATGLVGDYLQIKTSKLFIGEFFDPGTASGSGRIKIDTGTVACDIIIYAMANSVDSGKAACRLLANSASTNIKEIRYGSASLAAGTGETSTINDALISYESAQGSDASLVIGQGVTMGDLTCLGGLTSLKTSATNVLARGGNLTISGSGTITALTVDGGSVKPVSSGTITTCAITSGKCDFTASAEARTVTTLTLQGGTLQYDPAIVTITNKVEPPSGAGRTQFFASRI